MPLPDKLKRWKRLQKVILVLLSLIVLYTICGFFVLPPVLQSVLQKDLSRKLHRKVTIQTVAVNPYVLSLTLKNLTVRGASPSVAKFASFKKLYLNLQIMSLFKWACIVKQLQVTHPYLKIVRTRNGRYNFSDLMESMMQSKKGAPKPHSVRFSIDNIQISSGTIDVSDRAKNKHYTVRDIVLHLPFISNLHYYTDIWVKPLFKARVNNSTFSLKGKTKPFAKSRVTIFDVAFKKINLPAYLKYSPIPLQYKIPSGTLSMSGRLSFSINKANAPVLKFKGDMELANLHVETLNNKDMVKLPHLKIAIAKLEPLAGNLLISKIAVHEPQIHVRRNAQGKLNVLAMLHHSKQPAATSDKAAAGTSFSWTVKDFEVHGGKIFFTDAEVAQPFHTVFESLDLSVKNLSDTAGNKAEFHFATHSEHNARFAGSGSFSLNPVAANGTVQLTNVPIASYAAYYDKILSFQVDSGSLNCRLNYQLRRQERKTAVTLSGIHAEVSALHLRKPGQKGDFFSAPDLTISNGSADLASKRISIGTLQSAHGAILVRRNKQGTINLASLFANPGQHAPNAASPPQGGSSPWKIALQNGQLKDYQIQIRDLRPAHPLKVEAQKVDLTVQDIATGQSRAGHMAFTMTLGNDGKATCEGKIQTQPFSADLQIGLHDIDITPFQGYLTNIVKVLMTTGKLSADGHLLLSYSKTEGFHSRYQGKASIDNVTTVAAATSDDLLNWKKLAFAKIDAGNAPLHFTAGQVTLSSYYAHLWVGPKGKLNLFELLPRHAPQSATGNKAPKPFSINIGKVLLQKGNMTFDDQAVHPVYRTNLKDLEGTVQGLSSKSNNAATVTLRGTLADSSPLKIEGKIEPFAPHFAMDISTSFKNISLIPMNPFAVNYIGYRINKGKLSLNLKTKINNKQLEGQNRITLDQLTLGRKVNTDSAVNAPIKLALSLLENRQGLISLDIPISGDLSAPHFSLSEVIDHAVQGLLGKIVSSPFTLLGSLVGAATHGEQLKYVQFPYGSSKIEPRAARKLHTLAQALYKRPGLELDIEGHVDPVKDKKALQEQQLTTRLKKLATRDKAAVHLRQVTLTPQEYDKALRRLYAKNHPQASRESLKKLSTNAIKAQLLSQIKVSRHELRALAYARAMKVETQLLKSGKIAGRRIFIVQGLLAAKQEPEIKRSRATLTLN